MKRTLMTLFLALTALLAHAQMQSMDGGMGAYRKIVKEEMGEARMVAFYRVRFLKDSTKTAQYSEAQCVLQIGDSKLCFADYNQLAVDSLEIMMAANKRLRTKENEGKWRAAVMKTGFPTKLVIDTESRRMRAQIYTGLQDYEYEAAQPEISWTLAPGDTTINEIPCKKATCRYAGRNYTAWYSKTIPAPFGPYIFQGLPGLIMEIRDTKSNWIFTNNGFTKATAADQIYLYKKGFASGTVKKTTREKALEALRNETENKKNLMIELAGVKVLKNGKWVQQEANNPPEPSNLIELDFNEQQKPSSSVPPTGENPSPSGQPTDIFSRIHELQEVVVTVEPIRVQGDTLNYNVAAFRKKEDQYIEDVIRRLPGIDVSSSGEITYQGKSINKLNIEGLDLMGDRYNQATRNMPADAVAQIQVMENNQPVRALEGTMANNHATLNIKLKKEYRLRPFGEMGGGAGDGIWEGTATAIKMTPKNQWLVTATADNRGISLSSLATEMANNDRMYTNEPQPEPILQTAEARTPPISPLYWLRNKSWFAGVNYLHAFSKESNIRFNILYNHEGETRTESIFSRFLSDKPISIWQNESLANKADMAKGQVRYELNSESLYLEDIATGEISWINAEGRYFTNFSDIDETAERKPASFQNVLNSHIRLGEQTLTLSSVVRAFSAKENLIDRFLDDNEEERQTTRLTSFFMRNRIGTFLPLLGNTLRLAYISEHKRNNLKLLESSEDAANPLKSNLSSYWLNTLELGYAIDFTSGELDLAIPVEHIDYRICNHHDRRLLLAPSANLNLKLVSQLTADLTLGYNQDANTTDILHSQIHSHNFRTCSLGLDSLAVSKVAVAKLRLSWMDTSRLLSMGLFVGWERQQTDVLTDYLYTDAFTLVRPKWLDGRHHSLSAAYNIKKIFRRSALSLAYSLHFASNRLTVSQNGLEGEIEINALSSKLNATWDKLQWLHITAAGGLNIRWKRPDIFSPEDNLQRDFEYLLKLDLFPLPDMQAYADYTQIFHEISAANYSRPAFLNAGLKYTLRRNLTLKASALNLLNRRHYSESAYQTINLTHYEIPLRGRELLLGLTYRF